MVFRLLVVSTELSFNSFTPGKLREVSVGEKKKMEGAALTLVINKLSDLLDNKIRLIAGAEDVIRSLQKELLLLTIFLNGIYDQNDGNALLVHELNQRLRRVSWNAEDVVDQYLLNIYRHGRKTFVEKVFTGCAMLSKKCKLAAQAKKIKLVIVDIIRDKEKYEVLQDNGSPSDRVVQQNEEKTLDWRRRNVEEEDVVGFDQQICQVMEMLVPKGGGVEAKELRVVSVIGMGGLGKTTLARKIFNHKEIEFQFETKAWVVVSQHIEVRHVLKDILQYLNVNIEKEDYDYLKGRLKKKLDGRKYLIVLDDLWTTEQWAELKSYLPTDQKRGSRILLTSREKTVANVASTVSTIYRLNPLGDDDAWRLFCKKALKGEECPSNLEETGKGIVSKCKGLPLAIIVLGSLLSAAEAKPSYNYWSQILGDTRWHPDSNNVCSKILSLSYRNLPSHLKPCFLYVGVFPEDFEIVARELCLLWVAEGFVVGRSPKSEEDVAQEYLMDLADRNLIMISKRKSDGNIKSCRIHDLLRDLCMTEAEKRDLYKVDAIESYQNVMDEIRRLATHKHGYTTPLPPSLHRGLRTLLDFANSDSSYLRSVCECEDLSVMRVVHLLVKERGFREPIRIENMILLRHLKVDLRGGEELSRLITISYVSQISNLQVLNLISEATTDLPKGIWKLKFLRHIYVRKMATMPGAQPSHDSLPYLQTLSCIKYEEHTSKMLCPAIFPKLRKLSVYVYRHPLGEEALQSLCELDFVSLKICNSTPRLESSGNLRVDSFPSTLTKIHLDNTALTSDSWRLLGKLKNLQVLKLSTGKTSTGGEEERFVKEALVFEAEAFPQLLHLKLWTDHPDLSIKDGALRTLQYLIIRSPNTNSCCGVSALPDQLWGSTTLRQVKVIDPSLAMREYVESLDDSKRSKVIICSSNR